MLTYREIAILDLRYRDGLSRKDIGLDFGITGLQVKAIEVVAIKKLLTLYTGETCPTILRDLATI